MWDRRRGIWRPRQLGRDGAALAIVTAPHTPGKRPPYDDQLASNADWFVYRYEGDDPNTWTNVALRRAMEQRRPLVYLYGVTPGLYEPIFPCYVVEDNPGELAFHIAADAPSVQPVPTPAELDVSAGRRAYATAAVKVRLHQRRFRALVVSAYQERCAICRLGHTELLDAAHILPDRDERGRPEVPNGLSLCKIHHGAYDSNILGVDPDHLVHIRRDILDEHDGPMLLHGLQELHGNRITVPRKQSALNRIESTWKSALRDSGPPERSTLQGWLSVGRRQLKAVVRAINQPSHVSGGSGSPNAATPSMTVASAAERTAILAPFRAACKARNGDEDGLLRPYGTCRNDSMTVCSGRGAILADARLPSPREDAQIMVMPAHIATVSTIADLLALPDDGVRHELLDGVHAVTPSPVLPHQAMLREIHTLLVAVLERQEGLELFCSPADVVLGARTLVQPDLFVVQKQPGRILRSWAELGVPVLAVEVLSPGTAARDRGIKRTIYQRAGVGEYWIVDLDARLVERWRPDDARPEILTDVLTWQPLPGVPAVSIELTPLFHRVLGPDTP